MGIVDFHPLAASPLSAAVASAAFSRAADPVRDHSERQQQLKSLEAALDSVRGLLDCCQQETARAASPLAGSDVARSCPFPWPVCRRCLGVPLSCSGGTGQCRGCRQVTELAPARFRWTEPVSVVVRDLGGHEQAMCLPHAVGAVRQVDGVDPLRWTP